MTWLDVGQGDAAVIQCGGQAMLIDGGKPEKSSYIYAWLQQHGLRHLDVIVATHVDADHIGGLSGALNYASVGTAYCPVTTGTTKTFESFVKYLALNVDTYKVMPKLLHVIFTCLERRSRSWGRFAVRRTATTTPSS